MRLNEHLEHDAAQTVFQHACKLGLEGIVSKRLGSTLPFRPITRLGQVQEPGGTCSQAGGGRGLGRAGDDYPHPTPHP